MKKWDPEMMNAVIEAMRNKEGNGQLQSVQGFCNLPPTSQQPQKATLT